MADQSDASLALATAVAAILAPSQSGVVAATGNVVRIYPGWPDSASLQTDLESGICHVSIFGKPLDTQQFVAMNDMGWQDGPITAGQGNASRSVRRQTKEFAVTVWANTPAVRDALAGAIDAGLAAMVRLTLADGSLAPLAYKGSMERDEAQKVTIYRRDINYGITWDTAQSLAAFEVTTVEGTLIGGNPLDPGPTVSFPPAH